MMNGLSVKAVAVFGIEQIVEPVSLSVKAGHPLTIIGETGSGKSLLAQAIMGTLPHDLTSSGTVTVADHVIDLAHQTDHLQQLWGHTIAALPQEPWLALDPTMRAEYQVSEGYHYVQGLSEEAAQHKTREILTSLDLAGAMRAFPWQLSGGMAQRVAFAAACAGGADILIADEPTKGLDAARRNDVSDMLLQKVKAGGALLTITHDIALARQLGGDVLVMHKGKVIEQGPAEEVLVTPQTAYTKRLINADPEVWKQTKKEPISEQPVIEAVNVSLKRGHKQLFQNMNLLLHAGEVVGILGPSGCGKSSLGDVLLGLLKPDHGEVKYHLKTDKVKYQKIYQDPSALFPQNETMGDILNDLVKLHHLNGDRIAGLMQHMGLEPVLLTRYPSSLSGGELQRFSLLRVMLLDPVFIFADEPTSRLDPIVQQQTLMLLTEIAHQQQCAVLLVSHDKALLEKICHRVIQLGM